MRADWNVSGAERNGTDRSVNGKFVTFKMFLTVCLTLLSYATLLMSMGWHCSWRPSVRLNVRPSVCKLFLLIRHSSQFSNLHILFIFMRARVILTPLMTRCDPDQLADTSDDQTDYQTILMTRSTTMTRCDQDQLADAIDDQV